MNLDSVPIWTARRERFALPGRHLFSAGEKTFAII